MLVIKSDFSLHDFESALLKARRDPLLRLPSNLKHEGSWGNEIALIQLLMTWQRLNESPTIKTYINDDDKEAQSRQLSSYGTRMYGIAALYLTDKLLNAQGANIPKNVYAKHCTEVLSLMDTCDIYEPKSVNATSPKSRDKLATQFLCLHGSHYEFLKSLYDSPSRDGIISREKFRSLCIAAFRNSKAFGRYIAKKQSLILPLTSMLYELFHNTNDHAYCDLENKAYPKNIRGFIIKSHTNTGNLHLKKSSNDHFNEFLCSFDKQDTPHFIEISIVDGGPGLAQSLSGNSLSNLSLSDEKKITESCFNNQVSSKRLRSRGDGLDVVWRALCRTNGLIRIRTGRLCLFQTFKNRGEDSPRALRHWDTHGNAEVSGTAITIIIPCHRA
ncbi:MAG: hypothetical protein ACSHX4_10445 [Opitutaceae bacterium]